MEYVLKTYQKWVKLEQCGKMSFLFTSVSGWLGFDTRPTSGPWDCPIMAFPFLFISQSSQVVLNVGFRKQDKQKMFE